MTRPAGILLLMASLCLLLWAAPRAALAQGSVQLQLQTSAQRVEVGEPFQVVLSAFSVADSAPSTPRLKVPASFRVQGPSVSSQQQVTLSGGVFQQRVGISATWVLTAGRPGRYTIGPGSVSVGGRTANGDVVAVEVVAQGQAGRRQRGPSGSPFDFFDQFDPFGGLGPFPSLPRRPSMRGWEAPSPEDRAMGLPLAPEEYRVEQARDPLAFVRAVVEPGAAVVGQPVVLRIFAYNRGGLFVDARAQEASCPDFVTHTILQSPEKEPFYRVSIGGDVWVTRKLREFVLFPLRAGSLEIGSMKVTLELAGVVQKLVERETKPLELVVTEPPTQGRPSGYQLGDVGQFSLGATVEPRRTERGGSVSVAAKLEGAGNFPLRLRLPQQRGVEWLEPTVTDDLEPKKSSIVGTRRFVYVVRLEREGRLDLGELRLSYWDPRRQSYETIKATLGSVEISPSSKAPEAAAGADPLKDVLMVRKRLGSAPAHVVSWGDSPWYWGVLAAGPLGVLLLRGGSRGTRVLLGKWRARRRSSEYLAGVALGEARAAVQADPAAAASAVERALYLGIESATGLRARALLRHELEARLLEASLAPALAEEVRGLLEACDAIRFTGSSVTGAGDLVEHAARLMVELGDGRRVSAARGGA